jgi:hypothetical protein
MNLSQLQNLLVQAGWPDVAVNSRSGQVPLIALMASIAMAESSGNPAAHNTSGEDSVGLFQINRRAHAGYSVAQLQDPALNAQVALQIFQREGLNAWGAYTDGSYRGRGAFNQSLSLYGGPTSSATESFYENNEPAVYFENATEFPGAANPATYSGGFPALLAGNDNTPAKSSNTLLLVCLAVVGLIVITR